ncbi:MAG: type I methionyl aminopeptidase [Candidatus Eisenbacteria bacterium]
MIHLRSGDEVAAIRQSARMVGECLDLLETLVAPGVTTADLDRAAEEFVRDQKALPAFKGYRGYPAVLCVSVNDVVVHGIPDGTVLRDGDIVGCDMGVIVDGWYGDSARTFAVGSIDEESRRLLDVTRGAMHAGIAQAVEGNRIGDIGHAVQGHVEAAGFAVVRDLVGHGIGRQLHEDPQVPNYGRPGRGLKLTVGQVLAIEPMVNVGRPDVYTKGDGWTVVTRDGRRSAHFEHTIAVGRATPEILSTSPRSV